MQHTTTLILNDFIMIDLWLIIIALLNTLLLFLLNKKYPYNSIRGGEGKRKIFSLHIDGGLDFINALSRDFLLSMIFTHLLLFIGILENIVLWVICSIHVVVDIIIFISRIKRLK